MFEPEIPADVDEINLNSPPFWLAPAREREGAFELLRRQRPVSFHSELSESGEPSGAGYWALTRHVDILDVSRNTADWSSEPTVSIEDFPPRLEVYFRSMVNMDDPRHSRLRKIVSRGFTPAALAALEPEIQRRTAAIIDDVIDKGECDFVSDIAGPLPLLVICDMMGIPESQAAFVRDQVDALMDPEVAPPGVDRLETEVRAAAGLAALMRELGRNRAGTPREDLTSRLLASEIDGDALSQEELESFFLLLVIAGIETTRNAISSGMRALAGHPDQRRSWAADFERSAPSAVEEILRWATPVRCFRRTALRDASIRGQRIREGERVVLWYNSANRDSEVFRDPYHFDLTRTPNEHVAFGGGGRHHCLGASLARREITILFRELLRRIPDLWISGRPQMLRSVFSNGIKRMPCSYTPGGAG